MTWGGYNFTKAVAGVWRLHPLLGLACGCSWQGCGAVDGEKGEAGGLVCVGGSGSFRGWKVDSLVGKLVLPLVKNLPLELLRGEAGALEVYKSRGLGGGW